MKNKTLYKRVGISFITSLFIVICFSEGFLYTTDNEFSDKLYQKPVATSGDIVIVGIDEYALNKLGPFSTWSRWGIAKAIENLNRNSESKPSVIGIDILFTGNSDKETDTLLVNATKNSDNVVLANMANFENDLVINNNGDFYIEKDSIKSIDEPFFELNEVAETAHINGMYDVDGILRHNLLYLNLENGKKIKSFNYAIAEKFLDNKAERLEKLPPMDEHSRWYLKYSSYPGGYDEGISLLDVIEETVPMEMFAGKIVLIGPYATGLSDHFTTAVDHAKLMYGVEYQANCIEALLSGYYAEEISNVPQLIMLFIVLFLFILYGRDRKITHFTAVWFILTFGYILIAKVAAQNGIILHSLWLPVSVTVIYIAEIGINYIKASMEKRRITNTFKKYVAPEVVNEILKEGESELCLGGKLTDIAVLFVDIRGFTTMSELLTPTEVVTILNKYLNLTSTCIINNKGTLDKFIGDATMAFWGAPFPQEDYIFNAVKAALDMVSKAEELSNEIIKMYGRAINFGIGVHAGPAVVGNIGAKIRMDYTAIGDTVNTAARLESNAPAKTIYISRTVADALEGRIKVRSLGKEIQLKGKKEGFEVLVLEGLIEENKKE